MAGKVEQLKTALRAMDSVLVAFSGGVDSTFLLAVAHQVLGDKVLAVTILSDIHPEWEGRQAAQLARRIGAPHRTVVLDPLADERFSHNPPERCYLCKRAVFAKLSDLARQEGIACVADGSNSDDQGDFRPGLRALEELGIRSPLKEVGLTKDEIRAHSRELGLPTWDEPSNACLASRFPYGAPITRQRLRQVEQAEDVLRARGFRTCRVRYHGSLARIEVPPDDLHRLVEPELREALVRELRRLGFLYTALDLQGYRTGSMNEALAEHAASGGKKIGEAPPEGDPSRTNAVGD